MLCCLGVMMHPRCVVVQCISLAISTSDSSLGCGVCYCLLYYPMDTLCPVVHGWLESCLWRLEDQRVCSNANSRYSINECPLLSLIFCLGKVGFALRHQCQHPHPARGAFRCLLSRLLTAFTATEYTAGCLGSSCAYRLQ